MTDYTDLQRDIASIGDNFRDLWRAQVKFNDGTNEDSRAQWDAISEIRDDLLALSNRIETLTRALFMEPSEVANVERLRRDVAE